MIENIIYICFAVVLVASAHILSAIKSGCFYSAMRRKRPALLKKYIDNLHYVQTPFWYSLFGAFGILLFALFRVMNPGVVWVSLLSAYLIAQGTSAMVGPIYQGFINVGAGKDFIDVQENPKMELAFWKYSIWIPRFWYGKRRVYLSFIGLLMIIVGIMLL